MPALSNPLHERMAQTIAGGATAADAYQMIRPHVTRSTCNSAAYRISGKPEVKQRIIELRTETGHKMQSAAIATKQRLLEYLTEAIFTPVSELDETSPLIEECTQDTISGGKRGLLKRGNDDSGNEITEPIVTRTRVKMISKAFAIKQLCLMMGYEAPLQVEGEIRVKGLREFIESIRRPGLPRELHKLG